MKGMLRIAACAALSFSVSACVSNSGVVPDGPAGYRIDAVGDTGFSSSGKMQSRNYKQASEFCARSGKVMETITADSERARPLGGFPEASLRFRCVDRASEQ